MSMTIKEFQRARQALEGTLLHTISAHLSDFHSRTGVLVSAVSVDLTSIHEIGEPTRRTLVTDVRIHAEI